MSRPDAGGEMPFLDHLEELRARLVRALVALVAGVAFGLWAVERFQLVRLMMEPIRPFLPTGQLTVLSPTEPVMIVLKLGFVVGLVLASPFLIYQAWAFLAPALYDRERRVLVPALVAGLLLFLCGAAVAYLLVLPKALEVLFSFQTEALAPMITYDAYFGFVVQVVLAMGISFELPLVIVILAFLGVVSPRGLGGFRRYAVVLAFVAGAVLSPGTDVISMCMFTVPLLLLYEVGYAGAVVVDRRRARAARVAAAAGALLLLLVAGPAEAQQPVPRAPVPSGARPTQQAPPGAPGRGAPGAPMPGAADTANKRRLPSQPTRQFGEPDSAMKALLDRPGYVPTRFRADSATLFVEESRLELVGGSLVEREGLQLEADSISYAEQQCLLRARGDPKFFEQGKAVVGEGIRYDTCNKRGVLEDAVTTFPQGATTWFIRGDVAQDSSTTRIFAGNGEITSCDLPVPHYSFVARKIKWVSNTVIAARPVVLYLRDVPLLWLPFIFQDARPGRRSGILVPQFGFSDLVRPSSTYQRTVTNIGYYYAPNDYWDATLRLDWVSRRNVRVGLNAQYNVLDRFVAGSVQLGHTWVFGGGRSIDVAWDHRQEFSKASQLTLGIGFASNSQVVGQNAVDAFRVTQNIQSRLNFQQRYRWGNLALGGSRTQPLAGQEATSTTLPQLGLSFNPLQFGTSITWQPNLSLTNQQSSGGQGTLVPIVRPGGVDTLRLPTDRRNTQLSLQTPLRIGTFNWNNAISVTDEQSTGRQVITYRIPDPNRPGDSLTVSEVRTGTFSSGFDWNTGINLPILFQRTWKLTPSVNIQNQASGPFAIRNANTDGSWVFQGKRLAFGLTASPTLFAFLPGWWPGTSRMRHQLNPLINFAFAPASEVNERYAQAQAGPGRPAQLRSPQLMTLSVALNQNLEAKRRAPKADSAGGAIPGGGLPGAPGQNIRIVSINTTPVSYDFEQAKLPGRTGWTTQTLSNQVSTDIIPGFALNLTHDLWNGQVGLDTTRFSPFLTQASTNFTITGRTVRSLLSVFGLARAPTGPDPGGRAGGMPLPIGQRPMGPNPNQFATGQVSVGQFLQGSPAGFGAGQPFALTVAYTLSRTRPRVDAQGRETPGQDAQNFALATSFNPTPFWAVQYQGQYDATAGRFQSHQVSLVRWLHEWEARFSFAQSPNGNVLFSVAVQLRDLPQLRINHQEVTIER
ncbi:MAG: twin-arginine translocase subunit TatC [Gemmatimonadales bacterium]|nr:twin-arginine translocase subunit TatC [Gemmatimonadales bacterium]